LYHKGSSRNRYFADFSIFRDLISRKLVARR